MWEIPRDVSFLTANTSRPRFISFHVCVISNSNWTEWSTIQGVVIGRVISKLAERVLACVQTSPISFAKEIGDVCTQAKPVIVATRFSPFTMNITMLLRVCRREEFTSLMSLIQIDVNYISSHFWTAN